MTENLTQDPFILTLEKHLELERRSSFIELSEHFSIPLPAVKKSAEQLEKKFPTRFVCYGPGKGIRCVPLPTDKPKK